VFQKPKPSYAQVVRHNIMTRVIFILTFVLGTHSTYSQEKKNNNSEFLNLFPFISADNLHLYSPCDKMDGKKYEGKKIQSVFYDFFSFDQFLRSNLDHGANIFSCYKFKLSDVLTGLIVRTRSQYSETSIDLCIWDNQENKIIKRIGLADSFGDGLWYFVKDAWLVDINKDGKLDIVNRQMDYWEDETPTTNSNKEHRSDSLKIFLATGRDYKLTKLYTVEKMKFKILDWGER
jgi:hypothetical protein